MDLKYLLQKISPYLVLFYQKYEGTLRHKIHYVFFYHIIDSSWSKKNKHKLANKKTAFVPKQLKQKKLF